MELNEIENLIDRYLNKQCTEQESTLLEEWCLKSPKNRQLFFKIKRQWLDTDSNIQQQLALSKARSWQAIESTIKDKEENTDSRTSTPKRVHTTRRTLYRYCAASAIITLVLLSSVLFGINSLEKPQYTEILLPRGEKGQIYLADGTSVWLNSNSKIKVSNHFNTKDRKVFLEGEAFFEVNKHSKHKFVVQTDKVDIVVRGTSFDVQAYSESSDIVVELQTGLVDILATNTTTLLGSLEPNQKMTIDKLSLSTDKENILNSQLHVWRFEELIFDHEGVDSVFEKLENWYGVSIELQEVPENLKYRFKIKKETLREMLQLINMLTPIDYKVNGKEVTICYK